MAVDYVRLSVQFSKQIEDNHALGVYPVVLYNAIKHAGVMVDEQLAGTVACGAGAAAAGAGTALNVP